LFEFGSEFRIFAEIKRIQAPYARFCIPLTCLSAVGLAVFVFFVVVAWWKKSK
jgi:hypothetical protein